MDPIWHAFSSDLGGVCGDKAISGDTAYVFSGGPAFRVAVSGIPI